MIALLSISSFSVVAVKICWPAWIDLWGTLLKVVSPGEGVIGKCRKVKADLASCLILSTPTLD